MKKSIFKFFTALVCIAAAIFFLPLYGVSADAPPTFTTGSVTVYVGWDNYLSDISNISESATIKYKSGSKKIATVDGDGQVTGIAPGKTTIKATVKDGGKKYTTELKVTVKNPYSEITASTERMSVGSSFRFSLERYGHREPVKWSLLGNEFATIEADSPTGCVLTATAPGTVTLLAECDGTVFTSVVKIYEGTGEVFYITPETEPYNNAYTTYGTYNKKTKHYYMLRSYLEHIDREKGGVLVLSKGTYTVTNTLCIPSNCTLWLEDGARVLKSYDTGTTGLTYTRSLFQTVSFSNSSRTGIFKKYNGEHDINILGEGDARIDLDNLDCVGIVVGHCTNLKINGIRFLNLNSNHFIEIDATKNASITGNYFSGCVESSSTRKEAINIDTPDENTHGFIQNWTSYDKTPDDGILIADNVFYNLEAAVGTHKYSEGYMHKNINIVNNTFINISTYAIRGMNWYKPNISGNLIMLTSLPEDERIGLIFNGCTSPAVTNNRFENYTTPISFYHWQNSGSGSNYNPIYNVLEKTDIENFKTNEIIGCENSYVEYYNEFDNFEPETITKYAFS